MHRIPSALILSFIFVSALGGLIGCSTATTGTLSEESAAAARMSAVMEFTPAAHRPHQFYYYPEAQVYRDCEANRWYWMEAGQWQFGATLPQTIVLDTKAPFAVELNADDPRADHLTIASEYPGP